MSSVYGTEQRSAFRTGQGSDRERDREREKERIRQGEREREAIGSAINVAGDTGAAAFRSIIVAMDEDEHTQGSLKLMSTKAVGVAGDLANGAENITDLRAENFRPGQGEGGSDRERERENEAGGSVSAEQLFPLPPDASPEEWQEWRRNITLEVLQLSPVPAFSKGCISVARQVSRIGQRLFGDAFQSVFAVLPWTTQFSVILSSSLSPSSP
ncbi:hypothetical protein KIPB_008858 [Kipferlia bialata]|uniref:Uncharacterized protein n=1 Tax=Kipferlia bialata TaxID=797122 RepID=A0A9K3D304_9EUKA|nr:hypothetical protein KIPB_008858 [Kipferlia bialata]|eukprot:g8858.t1